MLKDLKGYYSRNAYRMDNKQLYNTILLLNEITSMLEKQLNKRRGYKDGANTNVRAS